MEFGRLSRRVRLYFQATKVLGSRKKAWCWLCTPNPALGGSDSYRNRISLLARKLCTKLARFERSMVANTESFPILQQYFLTVAVIEFRGSAIGEARDALGGFRHAVIFQKLHGFRLAAHGERCDC